MDTNVLDCLCNYAFVSDSFVAGFCVGVGSWGWVRVLAAQISHSIENTSFSFPLLNHLVSPSSSLSIPLILSHACRLPVSLPIAPDPPHPPSPRPLIPPTHADPPPIPSQRGGV